MSYCVNCGVELEPSLTACPLCHTPVVNPSEIQKLQSIPPYPLEKGQVDAVKRKDFSLLAIIILLATSVSCILLNLLVFRGNLWSLFVIGTCILLFVFFLPVMIYTRLSIYASLLFDGTSIAFFLFLITFFTNSNRWFLDLALPLVVLLTVIVELLTFFIRKIKVSFLLTALYLFVGIAVFCCGLELLIQNFLHTALHLSWSAIVLTVCCVIIIILITLLSKARFREIIRRRLHF